MLLLGLVCFSVCGRNVFKDGRAYLLRNLNIYFRKRYFSDMKSNSYPTWIFNLLEYFGKNINPLTKRLRSPVPCKTIHFKFISANNTTKKLTLCNKTHRMGPSKQVRHEYPIRKNFLLRVNHDDDNRKKSFLRLGHCQLKHHSLIKTF